MKSFDEEREEWYEAMKLRGHAPILDEDYGGLSIYVMDAGYHHGPGCSVCNWSCCMHCTDITTIPECTVMTIECVEIKGELT